MRFPRVPAGMPNFTDHSDKLQRDDKQPPETPDTLERRIFRATVIVIATAAAAYALWVLVDLLLLLFACTLVSLILLTVTNVVRRHTRLPFAIALGITVIGLLALIVGAFWFFGATLSGEFAELAARLPGAWAQFQERLRASPVGTMILERAEGLAPSAQSFVNVATRAMSAVGGAISGLAIVLVGGLYLAAQPALYSVGLLRLVPKRAQKPTAETLDAITESLRNWINGQALGMLFVGVGTGFGLWLIGVPAAWAIGLVAGLAEFVPYAGIILACVPALILGFGQSTSVGIWTLGVLVVVQQVQGNLVMPLLQNQMVDLPPAVTIFGIIAAGMLFGVPGVLLATPLTIVVLVLVRRVYLKESKDEVVAGME